MSNYSYTPYDPEKDKLYKQTMEQRQQHNAARPGEYQKSDNYGIAMDYKNQLQNREPFSFDVNADALYQQYKDNYIQQGQMAMMDTMGQAAAMTGGYGNSYAQSVGQQAYNQQLNQLNNIVPELYGMAYDRYQQEGQDLKDMYNLHMGLEDQNYTKWNDSMDRWYQEDTRLAGEEKMLYDRGHTAWADDNTQKWNEYLMGREEANNAKTNLQNLIVSSGYNPTDEELKAAGISREQANAWLSSRKPAGGRETTATQEEIGAIMNEFKRCETPDALASLTARLKIEGYSEEWIKVLAKQYDKWAKTGNAAGGRIGVTVEKKEW